MSVIAKFIKNEDGTIVCEIVDGQAREDIKILLTKVNAIRVPAKISDLQNDAGFITKTVNDLTNYYKKSDTYSQAEVKALVSAIPKFTIQVVEILPTSNISETTVYLLKSGEEESNLYTEYIFTEGKWEILGKQTVDLSEYALKKDIPVSLADLEQDTNHRTVTDEEKDSWNSAEPNLVNAIFMNGAEVEPNEEGIVDLGALIHSDGTGGDPPGAHLRVKAKETLYTVPYIRPNGTIGPALLPLASATGQGAITAAQFSKLEGIEEGATKVTSENIEKALGYTPADQETVDELSEETANKMSRPSIATIGQVIAVKAVDENGKPTEFMAVDQMEASGGGSGDGTETYEAVVKCTPTASDGVEAYPLTNNYIDSNGVTVKDATGYYVSRAYPIVDGCVIAYKGKGATSHKIVAFYDENGTFISGISPTASGVTTIEGTAEIPEGAKIVRFGTNGTDAYGQITYVASGEITVSGATYGISGSAWENALLNNGYYDRSGVFAATDSYYSSDYIAVNAQYIAITLYAKTYTSIGSVCFFDSDEKFISCTQFTQNTNRHSEIIIVPSDAMYYTLTIDNSSSSCVCVESIAIASSVGGGSSSGGSNGTAILLAELGERVEAVEEQVSEMYSETKRCDYTTIVNDAVASAYISATDGTEAATNSFKISDFVEINEACTVDYKLYGTTSTAMIAYYDEHRNYIGGIVPTSSGIHSGNDVVPPVGAFFIRYAVITSGYTEQYVSITRKKMESLFIENERQKNSNPLHGKILTVTGDSITATVSNRPYASYARMIAADNSMTYETKAIWGATIASGVDGSSGCILDTLSSMRTDADYVILSGGANDFYHLGNGNEQLGSITSGYTATLDTTTFCGALESMCKTAIEKWIGKKILYVITHRMLDVSEQTSSQGISILKQILEKWGIPYVDLWTDMPSLMLPALKNLYTSNGNTVYAGVGDGLHPNEDGYRQYYVPRVEAKLKAI